MQSALLDKNMVAYHYKLFLKVHGLCSADVVVTAGAAMVMQGLRDTTEDIDVVIDYVTMFDHLASIFRRKEYAPGQYSVEVGHVSVHLERRVPRPDQVVDIHGVCCLNVSEILAQKQRMNRPKDQKDIAALQARLAVIV